MAKKISRLHRKLSPTGAPMFQLRVGNETYTDDELHSVTIRHGSSGPGASHPIPTIEYAVSGLIGTYHNQPVSLRLTPTFASRFAGYSAGAFTAARLAPRFTGRGAGKNVTDERTDKYSTTATGSGWTALLEGAARLITPSPGERVSTLLTRTFAHPGMGNRIPTKYANPNDFDHVQGETEPATTKDIISKYATGIGIQIQQERDGTIEFLPISRRRALMLQQLESYRLPILRSQGISPAQWAQPIEQADTQYVLEWATANGTEYSQTWPLPDGLTPFMLEQQTVDWRHVTRASGNAEHLMNALTIDRNLPRTELQSLTIDLIYLLSSGNAYHRRIAAQLLALDAGDAVFLSRDWVPLIRGPYFAQEITETIAPNEWKLQLTLSHARRVLGMYDHEIPEVPARVWESARLAWNQTTATWNEGKV